MRARIRYAAITILIASVPTVLMMLATSGPSERGFPPEPVWQVAAFGAAQWYPWALLAPFIDRRVRRSRPQSRADRLRGIGGHAVMAAGFMIVHGMFMHVVLRAVEPGEVRPIWRTVRAELVPDAILYTAIAIGFTVGESRRRQTEVAERL